MKCVVESHVFIDMDLGIQIWKLVLCQDHANDGAVCEGDKVQASASF